MSKKTSKKTSKEEHEFITVEVTKYSASVNSSLNYELANLDKCDTDAKVYIYETNLEIEGCCTYPDKLKNLTFFITLFGTDRKYDDLFLKLKDFHAIDDKWNRVYKKVKGKEVPVYDLPDGIGYIEKRRGTNIWAGAAWVLPRTVTDMLTLLPHVRPLYLEIHALKKDRFYKMRSLYLQTNNPVDS